MRALSILLSVLAFSFLLTACGGDKTKEKEETIMRKSDVEAAAEAVEKAARATEDAAEATGDAMKATKKALKK